jgi:hypothetical protein
MFGENVPDFLVYANRLFDPDREFDGVRGIAYGGPDLSARNLAVLGKMRLQERQGVIPICKLPIQRHWQHCLRADSGRVPVARGK